jgi:Ca2+-binding RTX toxin-like protein
VKRAIPLLAAVLLALILAPPVQAAQTVDEWPCHDSSRSPVTFLAKDRHLTGLTVENRCDHYLAIEWWATGTSPQNYIVVAPGAKVAWNHADIHRLGLSHTMWSSGGSCCSTSLADFVDDNPDHVIEADGRLVTWARATSCGGKHATIFGRMGNDPRLQNFIYGTSGDDVIMGTPGRDSITSEEGDDIICAGYGDDHVQADDGRDLVYGGPGNDLLWGGWTQCDPSGSGNDDWYCNPEPKDDVDRVYGGEGNDQLVGGGGDDYLRGGTGNDNLFGSQGSDYLSGDQGKDRCKLTEATTDGDYTGPKDKASKTCETVMKKKKF